MSVDEALVAKVAAEVSERMASSAGYAQLAVAAFVEEQADAARFLSARLRAYGDGVVVGIFHAEVVAECLRRARKSEALVALTFADLDRCSAEGFAGLREETPSLADYLEANIDEETVREAVSLVALSLSRANS